MTPTPDSPRSDASRTEEVPATQVEDTRASAVGTALVWIGLRALTLVLFWTKEFDIHADVGYYFRKLSEMPQVGLGSTLVEYPTPVVWLLQLPQVLGGRVHDSYIVAFMVFMFLLDALMTAWLWHRDRSGRAAAATYWMVFTFLIGPLVYTRFDLVPAVLAAGALLLLVRLPAASGGLIALGASFKLWPALLVAGLFGRRDRRAPMWIGFAATGVALVLVSLLAGGWDRLVSPLAWQGERGLQVESIWATPPMLNLLADPGAYDIHISPYQAFEVFGPGVDVMLAIASVMTVAGGLAIIALGVRAWLAPEHGLVTASLVMTAVVAIMIVTNKTFSPQYMVWLAGPLAVLVLAGTRPGQHLATGHRVLLGLGLVLALATHVIYPLAYDWITYHGPGAGRVLATLVLSVRNVGMLVFTCLAAAQAWRALGRGRDADRRAQSHPTQV